MKLLVIIIVGLFLVTYSWDWLVRVPTGQMSTQAYNEYYCQEVKDQFRYFIEGAEKLVDLAKRPLSRVEIPKF